MQSIVPSCTSWFTWPRSAVGNMSDYRSKGREFDPGPFQYFCGDRSWNNFTAILLPSADSRRVVVSYKRVYVHEVLVNRLVKLAQEKSVVTWTDRPNMTITVDRDVKNQTKQIKLVDFTMHIRMLDHTNLAPTVLG